MTPVEDSATDTPAPRCSTAKAAAAPKAPRRRSAKADAAPPATKPARAKAPRAKADPEAKPARARTRKVVPAQPAQVVTLPVLTQDQPIGQAAQEIARIRAEMQSIRHMIDGQPVIHSDARTMLHRLSQDPTPRGMLAGSTASVIQLAPHLRRAVADLPDDGVPPSRPRRATGKARGRAAVALALPDAIVEAPIADALTEEVVVPAVAPAVIPAAATPRPASHGCSLPGATGCCGACCRRRCPLRHLPRHPHRMRLSVLRRSADQRPPMSSLRRRPMRPRATVPTVRRRTMAPRCRICRSHRSSPRPLRR